MAAQLRQNSVRNGTYTHLERSTVFDESGAVLTDFNLDFVRLGEDCLFERQILLYEHVDFRHRNHCIAECTRHVFVHAGDNGIGTLYGCDGRIGRSTERNVAVLVRSRNLYHRHVAREYARTIESLCLAEEYRDIVGISALRNLAHVAADEERIELENALEFGVGIRCDTLSVKVMDVYVLEFVVASALAHRLDKAFRRRCNCAQMNVIARFDDLYGLFRRCEFDLICHNCIK